MTGGRDAAEILTASNQKVAGVLQKMSDATNPAIMNELDTALNEQGSAKAKLDELRAILLKQL